jgi:hypothetical protein
VRVTEIHVAVAAELARLRAENARLLKMLELSPRQAAPPGPAQAGFFDAPPGPVHKDSPNDAKVAFFRALFAARADIYATRIENARTGWKGWLPAVRGGWQRGVPHEKRDYLPLTADVLAGHLKGNGHVGVYPLLDGDRCRWLVADFDGQDALTEALMYVKAGRAFGVPVALEVSRSGIGMHAWVFFTAPVPAETARRLGTGLLREAMAIRGKVNLASYDRLFPSQDLLPAGGVGNLIALPLFRSARDRNATVFLNLESLEPHQDQWSYLSTLGRITPKEVIRAADKAGRVPAACEVTRLASPVSTKIRPEATTTVRTRLGAGVRVELADLTPALAASLRRNADQRAARPRQLPEGRETNRGRRLTRAPSCGDDHSVRFPWQPQGYTRTCGRCGSIWQVSGSARRWWRSRLVNRFLARFVVITGVGVNVDQVKVNELVESISAQIRFADSLRHCPKCGADHFTQRASRGELPH